MTEPAISTHALGHTFAHRGRQVSALAGIDLDVPEGAFVSIVGPSGCGKSTLLRILAGLLPPTTGHATVSGHNAPGRTGLAAYMPQKDLLLPWRRALANATLGAEIAGIPRAHARQRALELFPTFGLTGFERAWPSQLSGGMRQRLALLRTFLLPSPVLLLDEPFGALDAITRRQMHSWLQSVWLANPRTVLLVTHDVDEALFLSHTVYVMSARPGTIAARVDVPFPHPRHPSILADPRFAELKGKLLSALDASP